MKDSSKNPSYVNVGWVKDAHALKGEVFIRLNAEKADWFDDLEQIRLRSEDQTRVLDFEVLEKTAHKNGLILKLNGVSDRNASEALKGLKADIPAEYLESKPGEAMYLHQIRGFEVIDRTLGSLGRIIDFDSNGVQDLLVVKPGQNEQLVPFIKPFIEEMNFETKTLRMNLPQGLIEMES